MRSLVMRCRGTLKISVSESRPILRSSLTVSRDTVSAFGPANQPVSTGYSAGCCVHQTGTVALENKNDKSLRSLPPQLVHHFVAKRSRILTTLPKPISVLALTFSRTPSGSEMSRRIGGGTVRIAASALKMVPSSQYATIRQRPCAIAVTTEKRRIVAPCPRHSDTRNLISAPYPPAIRRC